MASIPHKKVGMKHSDAYKHVGFESDARSFRPAAEILIDLKGNSLVLLSENGGKAEDSPKLGIEFSWTTGMKM